VSRTGPTTFDDTLTQSDRRFTAPLFISGFSGNFTDVTVSLHAKNTGPSDVGVALISPRGFAVGTGPTGPNLVNLKPNGEFNGVIDDPAVTLAPDITGTVTGTFRPLQSFKAPEQIIYNFAGNPDGGWRLVFFGTDVTGVQLTSWSLGFKG